jgi:hypothetical protein
MCRLGTNGLSSVLIIEDKDDFSVPIGLFKGIKHLIRTVIYQRLFLSGVCGDT